MPTFELTSPDGQKYRVTGPDGATEDDALQQLQSQLGQSQPGKIGRFLSNVYNNPPPTVAAIRDLIKGARPASMELVNPESPESAEQAAGTMLGAATLATPAAPRVGVPARAVQAEARPVAPAAPDAAALGAERKANYKAAADAGAEISPQVMRDIIGATKAKIAEDFDPLHAPATFKALNEAASRYAPPPIDPMRPITNPERVMGAAVRTEDGRIFSAPTHLQAAEKAGIDIENGFLPKNSDGYVTNYGRYVDRPTALKIAEAADQMKPVSQRPFGANRMAAENVKKGELSEYIHPDGKAVTGMDVEVIQQALRKIKATPSAIHDNAASKQARAMIDDALSTLPDEAFLAGNPGAYREAIASGRGNTAAMYRMKGLEAADERAALNANTAYSGGNIENAGRQSFKSLVRPPVSGGPSPAQKMGFNPLEQQAIRNISSPGLYEDAVRAAGKLAPTDPWKIAGNVGAAHATGGASLPLTAVAYAAKKYGDKLLDQRIQRAMNVVGQRSPLYQKQQREYTAQLTKYRKATEAAQKAAEAARAEFQRAVALRPLAPEAGLLLPQEQ